MRTLHTIRGARAGATVVEIVIAAIIMMVLFGAVGSTVLTGTGAYKQGLTPALLEGQARRIVERIAGEFSDVDRSSLLPNPLAPFGAATVTFARCQGWAGGGMILGPTRSIQLALETGELDNGLDDNGNGLVDERRVVLVPDTATPAQTVGWGGSVRELAEDELPNGLDDNGDGLVDEAGLSFRHDGSGTLFISLTLERLDAWGRPVMRTVRTAVRMRND